MKKVLIILLILSLISALPLALFACKKSNVNSETYDPEKYTESIDLTKYELAFSDEFEGELNREVWGDTRQGTRRDGYWTKNLAFTDGEGHLVIRTEKRGSRYCSETKERTVAGYNESSVKLTFDDCIPFCVEAYGEFEKLEVHTDDEVGYVILGKFDDLAEKYSSLMSGYDLPDAGTTETVLEVDDNARDEYSSFYSSAMELFTYYSFVKATKKVDTPLERSALINLTYDCTMTFGDPTPDRADLRAALATLFGYEAEEDLFFSGFFLGMYYDDYISDNPVAAEGAKAIQNLGFLTENETLVCPVAFRNESTVLLTYVIVDKDHRVSIWVNDTTALLRMVNYDYDYYSGARVNNESFCKNSLFVTGPEGVYSGALRTMDYYTHGFGYYEIRCKLPAVDGIWHAFWLMCGNVYSEENGSTDGIEIDVFEYLPARDAINCALHWDGYDEAHKNDHLRFENVGCADDEFHTFGMNWDEEGYAFYIDGKKVWHSTGGGVCPKEGYMKISTEYGEWGDWVGDLDTLDLPVDWVIDYVKIYDKLPA